jgi:uncharacterized damage-inducible protein DinB
MDDFTALWKTPTRLQAVSILTTCRAWTEAQIAELTPAQMQVQTALGDGTWTIKDLLGHLTAWERRALDVATADQRPPASPFASAHEFNANELEVTRAKALEDVQHEYDEVRSRLVATIDDMSDERWMEKLALGDGRRSARALIICKVLNGGKYGYLAHDFDHRRDLERAIATLKATARTRS